jgi:hypothetical protein
VHGNIRKELNVHLNFSSITLLKDGTRVVKVNDHLTLVLCDYEPSAPHDPNTRSKLYLIP